MSNFHIKINSGTAKFVGVKKKLAVLAAWESFNK